MATQADTKTAPIKDWEEGDVLLGLYQVRRLIAHGGMGNVYLVRHRGWDVDLAVKCPKAEVVANEKGARLFEKECETWVNLGLHPNVASCYYVRRIDGIPRVFAEYVNGGTLSSWIHRRTLYEGEDTLARMLDVAIQFAWGLRYAHAQGLLHQDVKPLNVLMTKDGVAKVTDFGLSRALTLASAEAGATVRAHRGIGSRGTPVYCSPEQAYRRPLTFATDIWSWAVSILEMFTGEVTWMAGQSAGDALEHYLALGPEYASIPEMPSALIDLLRRCFREDPGDRPSGMNDVIDTLLAAYRHALDTGYPRPTPEAVETSAERLNNRAVSLIDLGKKEEARQTWRRAVRIAPGHLESTYNYLLCMWREGLTTDITVLRMLKKLRKKHPKSWKASFMLAQAEAERGDYREALSLMERNTAANGEEHELTTAIDEVRSRLSQSRGLIKSFGRHEEGVSALCLSGDAHLALSGDRDGEKGLVRAWNVERGENVLTCEGHLGEIQSIALSADGLHAASASTDCTVRIWDLANGKCLHVLEDHEGVVTQVLFTDDGQGLLSACEDGVIRLWNRADGKLLLTFSGHLGQVDALCPGVPGHSFFSAGQDRTLRQWDLRSGQCVRVEADYRAPLTALAVSEHRRYVLAGTRDGHIELYDALELKRMGRRRAHSEPVVAVCMGMRGRQALSAVRGGKIRLWELAINRCVRTFRGMAPLAMDGGGTLVLSAGPDGQLQLWMVGLGNEVLRAPMMLCQSYGIEDE